MDTFKAAFEVDNYEAFVKLQTDSAVRRLAGLYAYDNFDADAEVTLRSGHDEVNHALEENLRNRLEMAGIHVIEARIGHLAYAPEIAGAMLRRQQATAVVSARFKIVEGAVSMVQMALDHLSEKQIVELDEERKAAMVSNLMVVLCSDKDVSPVINAGTLNH
jgi:regulator of protease activity HflC (stomatin/prohibitin superfamily)